MESPPPPHLPHLLLIHVIRSPVVESHITKGVIKALSGLAAGKSPIRDDAPIHYDNTPPDYGEPTVNQIVAISAKYVGDEMCREFLHQDDVYYQWVNKNCAVGW